MHLRFRAQPRAGARAHCGEAALRLGALSVHLLVPPLGQHVHRRAQGAPHAVELGLVGCLQDELAPVGRSHEQRKGSGAALFDARAVVELRCRWGRRRERELGEGAGPSSAEMQRACEMACERAGARTGGADGAPACRREGCRPRRRAGRTSARGRCRRGPTAAASSWRIPAPRRRASSGSPRAAAAVTIAARAARAARWRAGSRGVASARRETAGRAEAPRQARRPTWSS